MMHHGESPAGGLDGVQTDRPLVSCVVITMNRRQELPRCLTSLLSQTYRPLEWIVVDNASTDGTGELVREEFPAVRLVELSSNQGVPGARNRGVEAAQGAIVLFLDDDAQLVDDDAVDRAAKLFFTDPQLVCVSFLIRDGQTGDEERRSIPRVDKRPPADDYQSAYFCGTGFAVRREAFQAAGAFWEPLVYSGEEIDLSYRLLERGGRVLHSRRIEVVHRPSAARPSGQYVYYNLRSRCWVAVRNLPWPYVLSTTLCWWLHGAATALRQGYGGAWLRGTCDALRGIPAAWRTRRVISPRTRHFLRQHSGRLWY